jgi:hypothetical protein
MCWNADVSLKTFIIGSISALICLYLHEISEVTIMIVFSFTLIQLLEYFAWKYINDKNIIYYLSIIGQIIIFTQLFLLNYFVHNKKYQKGLMMAFFMYIFLYIIFVLPKSKFNMKKGINGHLEWEWLKMPIIFLFLEFLLYSVSSLLNKNYLSLLFILITIFISLYNYYKYNTWGTMWCYFSNVLWFVFILFSFGKKYGYIKSWSLDYY